MFMTHPAPPNGLDPGDRMPGTMSSVFDEMDGIMSDWSWRPRLRDMAPAVYQYNETGILYWEIANSEGRVLPAQVPWSFPAYRGPAERPTRIGVTR